MDPAIIDAFARKVWITRKSRIEAAGRLSTLDTVFQFMFLYYALWIVGLSVWNVYSDREGVSLTLVVSSTVLFGLSQFVAARNFRGRADLMRECYIELDSLHMRTQLLAKNLLPCEEPVECFVELEKRYASLLRRVENHCSVDYYRAIQFSDESINRKQWLSIQVSKLGFATLCLAALAAPFLSIVFFRGLQ